VDLIATTALSKRYGRTMALRDVTIVVPAGGVTALVGPNGAGKSTLLKLCIGSEHPTSGRIEVLGVDPTRDRAEAVAQVGYVPQSPSLYGDLPVGEHLVLASSLRAASSARMFRRVGGTRVPGRTEKARPSACPGPW
jgi:ABC-2 type transport system ATP-binding protein